MPVFNAENMVKKSIKSILKQTYENWELVIINDGSNDNSLIICRLYAEQDSRIRIINIKNSGPAFARQIGINESCGEYIAFCDADDFLEENMIEKMVHHIECGYELVICRYNIKTNNDKVFLKENLNKEDAIIRCLTDDNIGGYLWNKLFLRNIIKKNHISFDSQIYYCEDLLFVIQYICCCNKVRLISDRLYNHEEQPNSLSNGFSWKKLTNVLAREKIQLLLQELQMKECMNVASIITVQQAVYAGRDMEKNKIKNKERDERTREKVIWYSIKRICKKYKLQALRNNNISMKMKFHILRFSYFK